MLSKLLEAMYPAAAVRGGDNRRDKWLFEGVMSSLNLPYRDEVVIEGEKVKDYLLSPSHPTGKGKAEFHDIPSRAEVYCRW